MSFDTSDKSSLTVFVVGAVIAALSFVLNAPTWTSQTAIGAALAGFTYFYSHETKG